MPRSIWNGTITFGLVNVPVKLYAAIESKTVHFSEVHANVRRPVGAPPHLPQGGPRGRLRRGGEGLRGLAGPVRDPREGRGQGAAGDRGKVVHLTQFVDAGEIDAVFFDKTYFVGSRDAKDAYRLLHEALRRTGRAGIGRFTFHDREYLVAVRGLDDVMALHTLRFHDTVVSPDDLDYRERLRRMIERRRRRKIEVPEAEKEPAPAPDLMAALERALENVRSGKDPRADTDGDGSSNGDGDLAELSREELYERAQKKDIPGRTKMSKKELVDALSGGES